VTLRLRLAIWYGALAGAVVILSCVYGYAVHGRTHYDQLDVTLRQTGAHVRDEFVVATSATARTEVLHMAAALGTQVRLYGQAQTMATAPRDGDQVPLPDITAILRGRTTPAWPRLAALAPSFEEHTMAPPGALGLATASDGTRWRINVLPLPSTDGGLLVAAPLDHLDASVAAFGRFMTGMAILGAVLTFATGWLVAGRALQPVATLTSAATDIAVSRAFSRRVPTTDTPDELGRLARTFNEMLGSLEQAYATERRFVADASHELRAPLAVVQANLELLQRAEPMSPADQHAALHTARTEADRLRRLVNELLVLARTDAGTPITRAPLVFDALVADVVVDARHLAHGQTFVVGTLTETEVLGDPERLRQLLVILLDNAFRYTPASGRVEIGLSHEGDAAVLRLRDTGIGIDPKDVPYIFDRFFRADPARQRDAGGNGLGLAIARSIAHEHGGEIGIESTVGVGTSVSLRLPMTVDAPGSAPRRSAPTALADAQSATGVA
jgi:two-component system, OmpR family, sensor kinase